MSRFAKTQRVFFVEEPLFDAASPYNEINQDPQTDVCVVTPHLPPGAEDVNETLRQLLDGLIETKNIASIMLWYYLPLGLSFTDHLQPAFTVYDCMDEHSGFKFAHPEVREAEKKLMDKADIVFTGGMNLYEAKKHLHHNIHGFPSSIDKEHFAHARVKQEDPADQENIPHPRIGFYGVVDERFNLELITELAGKYPEWHFVVVGPVVKIDPATLPRMSNTHWLGKKEYNELPSYLAGWDIAMMPFALNESTEFISPTKTPEYLAGGKPVVSTSIKDVVDPYGKKGLVEIADNATEFSESINRLLAVRDQTQWIETVDDFLSDNSWDNTWQHMLRLINGTMQQKNSLTHEKKLTYV
jgi:UDP-galactopyranose mutase